MTDVSVVTMRLSDGREEYFVMIKKDGREVSTNRYRQPYYNRALYERDEIRHVLLGHDKPDLMSEKYADPTPTLKEDSPMDILYRLKQPLVMSMFASKNHLYQEGEAQRAGAADEIKRLRRALAVINNYTNDEHVQGICRGYLGGGDHG